MKKIMVMMAVLALCLNASARKVTGCVVCGDEKLSGVIVTDGVSFTQTGRNGKFSFDIGDDAEFVYIVTPSGYTADWSTGSPAFWQRAEGKNRFVFELLKTGNTDDYSIIAVGDPQPKSVKHFEMFAGKPLDALCAAAGSLEGHVVGIALGDICWDVPELMESWKKEIVSTGIPFYTVPGNHDHDREVEQGDIEGTSSYREILGPENYAFFIGGDIVIAVDDIIYKGRRKYDEGYAAHVLDWVKGLMKSVPADADVYVAQHSPIVGRGTVGRIARGWTDSGHIIGAEEMMDLLRGHRVTFLSGHNHVSGYYEYRPDVTEHNVASICGTWWDVNYCTDGTPRGFKVFTRESGKVSWRYRTVDYGDDYMAEVFPMGHSLRHPNAVVANVWDYDPGCKVEWYEDGVYRGNMDRVLEYSPSHIRQMKKRYSSAEKNPSSYRTADMSDHFFAAVPRRYARNVTVAVQDRFGRSRIYDVPLSDCVEVQAAVSGGKPMDEAKRFIDMGVNTLFLELDVSERGEVVARCGEENVSAAELMEHIEQYTRDNGLTPVMYTVEVAPDNVETCMRMLLSRKLDERLVVQSSDLRSLDFMHGRYPDVVFAYQCGPQSFDFDRCMSSLDFTPKWIAPHFSLVDEQLVRKCREKEVLVAPWGMETSEDIERMLGLNADALSSPAVEKVLLHTRGYIYRDRFVDDLPN